MIDIQAVIDKQSIWQMHLVPRQIPFAMRLALSRTAKIVLAAETKEIGTSFDKPTPFARNSLKMTPASKEGEPVASVEAKDARSGSNYDPTQFLSPEIRGGSRTTKRFEQKLISAGLMPSDKRLMPARTLALDSFGNIPRSLINKLVKQLGTLAAHSKGKLSSRAKGGFRVLKEDLKLANGTVWPAGIYNDSMKGSNLLLIFVKQPKYKPRFGFYTLGNKVADATFAGEFDKALTHALKTAK